MLSGSVQPIPAWQACRLLPIQPGGAKEMPALQALRRLWSLASVLGAEGLLSKTLRDSGAGIREETKFPSLAIVHCVQPHHDQLTFNGRSVSSIKMLIGVFQEKKHFFIKPRSLGWQR